MLSTPKIISSYRFLYIQVYNSRHVSFSRMHAVKAAIRFVTPVRSCLTASAKQRGGCRERDLLSIFFPDSVLFGVSMFHLNLSL